MHSAGLSARTSKRTIKRAWRINSEFLHRLLPDPQLAHAVVLAYLDQPLASQGRKHPRDLREERGRCEERIRGAMISSDCRLVLLPQPSIVGSIDIVQCNNLIPVAECHVIDINILCYDIAYQQCHTASRLNIYPELNICGKLTTQACMSSVHVKGSGLHSSKHTCCLISVST